MLRIILESSSSDYKNQVLNEFDLPNITTQWARLETLAEFDQINTGFLEVEFYTGTSMCFLIISLQHDRSLN